MNKYEAMFIFPETMNEEELDTATANARAEIEKLGGRVTNATRLGKRGFARPLGKRTAGQYVVGTFELDGDKVRPLLARYKLSSEVFRVQITAAREPPPAEAQAAPAGKEQGDGNA